MSDRIRKAVESYSDRQIKKVTPRKTKNKKPEEAVVKAIYAHLKLKGFACEHYESKYINRGGIYLPSGMTPGTPDLMGQDDQGIRLCIEVKAPGRRSNLSPTQRDFLELTISLNGFGVCCDSVEQLKEFYETWRSMTSLTARRSFLTDVLPKRPPSTQSAVAPF